jgi:hypothetical protein
MKQIRLAARCVSGAKAWAGVLGVLMVCLSAVNGLTAKPFFVYTEQEQTGDAGLVTNLVWVTETNWFRLAPVPNWRVRANGAGRRLELLEAEGTAAVLLRSVGRKGEGAGLDAAKAELMSYPGFRLIQEFDLGSGCGPARVMDLVMNREGEAVVPSTAVRRVALVAMEDGVLECTLTTSWRWLESLQAVFARLLVSVRRVDPPPAWDWTGD